MNYSIAGVPYIVAKWGDRLCLLKAAKYDQTQSRTDDKGRTWEFNTETRRWRIKRDSSSPESKSKPKRSPGRKAQPVAESAPEPKTKRSRKAAPDQPPEPEPKAKRSRKASSQQQSAVQPAESNPKRSRKVQPSVPDSAIVHDTGRSEKQQTQQDRINEKYASAQPSDEDVASWVHDSLHSPPDAGDVHRQAVNDLKNVHGVHEKFFVDDVHDYAGVQDKAGWMQSVLSHERSNQKAHTWQDFSGWGASDEKALNAARKRSTSARASEMGKARALKQVQQLERKKANDLEVAQSAADRMNARNQKPDTDRLQELSGIYDQRFAQKQQEMTDRHQKIKAGDRTAYQQAFRQLIFNLPNHNALSDKTAQETVREFLQQSAIGKPEAVLGLPPQFDLNQLKSAYRQKARSAHPDMGGNEAAFRQITDAYQKLLSRKSLQKSVMHQGQLYVPIVVGSVSYLIRS